MVTHLLRGALTAAIPAPLVNGLHDRCWALNQRSDASAVGFVFLELVVYLPIN